MDEPQTSSESFPQFKEIDDVLKCGICYETLVTPVITSCSHTFCSICIRRWLSSKQICPSCSESIYEAGLRKNTIVGNILDAVVNLKNKISRKSGKSASGSGSSSCPKNEDEDFQPKISVKKAPPATPKQNCAPPEPKPTPIVPKTPPVQRSPVVQPKTPLALRSPMMVQRSPEVESTPRGERPQPVDDERSPAIKVPCPVCQVVMPQRLMNDHLDRCLLDPKPRPRSSELAKLPSTQLGQKSSPKFSNPTMKNIPKSSTSAESSNPPLQPIKTKVYNLMSDKQIKAELKKYGLATQGDRRTLVSRLQKFVILHNAECDSDRPRSLVELKQHLEKEEKAVSSASVATNFSQMFKKTNNPEEIESANKTYITQNKSSFQRLIEDVRNRKKKPSPKEEPITLSDTEDDPEPAPIQNPVPAKTLATSPFKVDSDTDDIVTAKSPKQRTKIISKKKRKCIESESEEEDNDDDGVFKKLKRQEKRVEEATSPVLSRKTPARQLRSRTVQTRTSKKEIETPQVTARNSKRGKQAPKQIMTRVIPMKDDLSSNSSDEDASVIKKATTQPNPVKERSPTPDFFDASPSSSRCSSLPCGQRVKNDSDNNDGDGSENDALDTLVEMIENEDAGSTTDFED